MITVFTFYFRAFIAFLIAERESKGSLAFESLLKLTYYLPESANRDRLIGFKILLRLIKQLIYNKSYFKSLNSSSKVIYDTNRKNYNYRTRFLAKYFKNKDDYEGLFREELMGHSGYLNLLALLLILIPIGAFSGIICIVINQKRAGIALLPSNLLVSINFYNQIKKIGSNGEVYYFNIFEQNANIDAWILEQKGISMVKIPSEVPLAFDNSILIADKLGICFPYQKEEIDFFSKTMKVSSILELGPENTTEIKDRLPNPNLESVAFCSSAFWLRDKLNHPDIGLNSIVNEEKLFGWLLEYTKSLNLDLIIYVHPLEKRPENMGYTKLYYNSYKSKGYNFSIVNYDKPSNSLFKYSEIGVALFSTILFERLYNKLPTIIVPLGVKNPFPVSGSDLNNISCLSSKDLAFKLDQSMGFSNDEFFSNNLIEKYCSKKLQARY